MKNPDYVLNVLALFDQMDAHNEVTWSVKGDNVRFFVSCNDFFAWGCADAEEVTPDNLDVLRQAFEDTKALGFAEMAWAGLLFCARVAGLRPQGRAYPKNEKLWPLFDACGPKREIDIFNPYAHPADGGQYEYRRPEREQQ